MKKQISAIIAGLLILSLSCLCFAQKRAAKLTIFPNGLGLVEEERTIAVKPGVNEITFGRVSDKIILDSVYVRGGDCKLLEEECSSDWLLSWKIRSQREQEVKLQVFYLTTGLSWSLGYQLEVNKEEDLIDVNGVARVKNQTKMNFSEFELVLATQLPFSAETESVPLESMSVSSSDTSYLLPYPVTLRAGGEKRLVLISKRDIPVNKVYLLDTSQYGEEVREELWFINIVEEGLGILLPEGKAYVWQAVSEKSLIFLGEVQLPEVPIGKEGKIYLRSAENLRGEKFLTGFKQSYQQEEGQQVLLSEYSYKIVLSNVRQFPVTVMVVERYHGKLEEGRLESDPAPYAIKEDLIIYEVEVPPYGEKSITYTARTKSVHSGSNTTGE